MLLDDFFGPPFPFEDRFRNDPAGLEVAEEEEEEDEFSLADAMASASVDGETAESSTREGRSRIEGTGLSERWGEYESSVKRRKRASRSVEGNGSSLHKEGRKATHTRLRACSLAAAVATTARRGGTRAAGSDGKRAWRRCARREWSRCLAREGFLINPVITNISVVPRKRLEHTDKEFGQHGRAPHPELGRRAPLVTVRGGREAGGSPRFADHDPCDDGEERHGVFEARAFLDGLSEEAMNSRGSRISGRIRRT